MTTTDLKKFRNIIYTALVTVVVGNLGVLTNFYYSTKYDVEYLKEQNKQLNERIIHLQGSKADNKSLQELKEYMFEFGRSTTERLDKIYDKIN